MDFIEIDPMYATVKSAINDKLTKLEKFFKSDVIFFYGEIAPYTISAYRSLIENLNIEKTPNKKLAIFLNTPGGIVETVERYVNINRRYYDEVFFIVPDQAMSAGTVFCMSGDKIFMDYSSSLGPIDPQVFNGERYVPALGYLDKINDFIKKAEKGELLNQVELLFLQKQDIAFLQQCEQQSNLTVKLICEWLEKYKFKNWKSHKNSNIPVTPEEKKKTAMIIAEKLRDNTLWLSHGRSIDINKLIAMGLDIDDYSNNLDLKKLIREYNDLIISFIQKHNMSFFLNSRLYF